jgi:hypothetical protein
MGYAEISQCLSKANESELALLVKHRNDAQPPSEVPLVAITLGLSGRFHYLAGDVRPSGFLLDEEIREQLTHLAQTHAVEQRWAS